MKISFDTAIQQKKLACFLLLYWWHIVVVASLQCNMVMDGFSAGRNDICVLLLHVLFHEICAVLRMFLFNDIFAHFIFLFGTGLSPQQQGVNIHWKENKGLHIVHYLSYLLYCFSKILRLAVMETVFIPINILMSIHMMCKTSKYIQTSVNPCQPFCHMIYKGSLLRLGFNFLFIRTISDWDQISQVVVR